MSYELDLINYQNKCKLIRGWDDLFTKVKEHINSVMAMKLSPYFKVGRESAVCHLLRTEILQTLTCFCLLLRCFSLLVI